MVQGSLPVPEHARQVHTALPSSEQWLTAHLRPSGRPEPAEVHAVDPEQALAPAAHVDVGVWQRALRVGSCLAGIDVQRPPAAKPWLQPWPLAVCSLRNLGANASLGSPNDAAIQPAGADMQGMQEYLNDPQQL